MKILWRYLRRYPRLMASTFVVSLLDNTGTLLVPTMLATMINDGIMTGDARHLVRGGLCMLAASLMASGGALIGSYLSARLASRVARDIRRDVYNHSLAFSGEDFERFGTGSMITRTLNDVNVIQQSIVATIQMVLPVPLLCVVGIAMACMIDIQMGMLLAVVIAAVVIAASFTLVRAAPIFSSLQTLIDRMNVVLRESIVGVRVIRAFTKEQHDEQRLSSVFGDYAARAVRVNRMFAGLDCSAFLFMNLAEAAVLWLGGERVGVHAIEIASITAVLEYAMLILFYIMMAQTVIITLPRARACLARVAEVIDLVPQVRDNPQASTFEQADQDAPVLAFDRVSLRFAGADEDTLHDVSFTCRRGTTTAIIGQTGSGKSTVVKLALRFHDASAGSVRMGGQDVQTISQALLRSRIAYVPQRAWLFSGTVASNLAFGDDQAEEAQMRHALEVAQADFVYGLPGRLQALIAQGGTNLSGGQRQRLAIARALMRKADLYIFDDSFSALDFATDARLRRALVQQTRNAAVLVVAQRVSTIASADQIIVLHNGRVEGIGTHQELLETCGAYQDIVASQTQGGEACVAR